MRRPKKQIGIVTDLIIGDCVSNLVHEFSYSLNILLVFRIIRGPDASQEPLKLVLDPMEGARKD